MSTIITKRQFPNYHKYTMDLAAGRLTLELLIPLIYIMPHMISDSTTGVYMAEPIADITAVIFTSVLFTFQFKKALAEIQN